MKKYLNSVEEFVKALAEDKCVMDEATDEKIYIETHNNKSFVCSVTLGDLKNKHIINKAIVVDIEKRYYTEEPEPLKFEVNRAYKTRGGLKYFLNEINKDNGHLHFIRVDDNYWTNEKGMYTTSEEANGNDFNIVGYWEEDK